MKIEPMGVGPGEMDVQLPFTGPVRPTTPPPEKPKYGIVIFGLLLAGAYLILGGKKN